MKILTIKRIGVLAVAGLTLQLASCVSTEREVNGSGPDPRATYTPPVGERTRIGSKTVLNTVRATHAFSNPATQDNFVLQLRGPRVLTGLAHLIVTSSTGDTLSHEVLPARALLNANSQVDPVASTTRDQEIAILQRMNTFFADGRFIAPAVAPTDTQPAELDAKTWTALRDNAAAVGFDYTGADGGARRLTYVRKLGRAVVISR